MRGRYVQRIPEDSLGKTSGLVDAIDLLIQPSSIWATNLAILARVINPYLFTNGGRICTNNLFTGYVGCE
jgi:hypothetical protein